MYVKGLSRGNPGPSGIGVIICDHWGRIVKKIGESIGVATGTYSEFRALLRGIEEIRNLNAFRVKVLSDSEAVIRHMTGITKVKGDDLVDLLEQIRALSKGIVMEFIQIHPMKNREAENLAREALEKKTAPPQKPAPSMSPQPAAQPPMHMPSQVILPGEGPVSSQPASPSAASEKPLPQEKDSQRGEIDIRMIKAAVQRAMLLEEFTKAPDERAQQPARQTGAAAPRANPAAPPANAAAPPVRAPVIPPPPPEKRIPRDQPGQGRDRLDQAIAQSSAQAPHEDMIGEDCLEEREERQISAGGVVYKKEGGRYKVCLIAKKNKRVWALPKGRLNPGENLEETAQREIAEETGLLTEVHEKLDEISYYFYWKDENVFYHKTVYFYLMPVIKENYCQRDTEVDAVIWLTLGEAYKKLTYLNEKEVLKKAQKILKSR
jgi:8-oxo-dGTP diphosphatase